VTCDDGEGEGEVDQAHPIDEAHHAMRQHATPRRTPRTRTSFRGDWERGEDDGNSARMPSPSSLTFNR